MEDNSDFERETRARLVNMESAISALAQRMDAFSASARPASDAAGPEASEGKPFMGANASPRASFPDPKPHRPVAISRDPARGVDWWLARAGAGLTVVAVILLYQYAVGHGWITPLVRVLTGVAVGAALMYWGRKMPAAEDEDTRPVALRELMMGSALAAWYISAFAASMSYHLIEPSASRVLFLVLSIAGAVLGLRERRSLLALVAIGAGFLAPVILPSTSPSIPAFAVYLATIGGLGLVLYLMRGWQSVLWISLYSLCASISAATSLILYGSPNGIPGVSNISVADIGRLTMSLLIIVTAVVFARAPSLRRGLVATGSDRYPEPIRSRFAKNWLSETGRFFKLFSPAAGNVDSLSMWVVTLAAPLAGVALMSTLWPAVSNFVWGAILVVVALSAYRICTSSSDESAELTHIEGAAFVVWGVSGILTIGRAIVPFGTNGDALILSLAMISATGAMLGFSSARYVAVRAAGRAIAVTGVLFVGMSELALLGNVRLDQDRLRMAMTVAEAVAIVAGFVAWKDLQLTSARKELASLVAVLSYGALLLVDARALGAIWTPLVTASFAIAGTSLLILSRKTDDKLQRAAGGATLALVVFRLFFVDLAGVDTIWRVFLFLGIGALFLFTSRQLQNDRASAAPGST